MTIATALVSGNMPSPELAERAVLKAMNDCGLNRANAVLLFLTPEFARHAQAAITAAARAAQCLQVVGGIAAGVFTEAGWILDRPAAAVMVFGGELSLGLPDGSGQALFSYAGSNLPGDWREGGSPEARFGGIFSGSVGHADPVAWQQGRLSAEQYCSVQIHGAATTLTVSSGLRLLSAAQRVDESEAYDLQTLGGRRALDSLQRALPPEYRHFEQGRHSLLLQHLSAVLIDEDDENVDASAALLDGRGQPTAIIGISADQDSQSLTLAERVHPGQHIAWAIRQPVPAEQDMRLSLQRLAYTGNADNQPRCALMFSCIGRGPYFYGGEDRDLDIMRQHFPGLPLLGVYGTGQIAPSCTSTARYNRQLQNAVVTALISTQEKQAHVQSITR